MPGAILDLVAKGERDKFFIGNPQTTFFSTIFHKKVECIIYPYRINFKEDVDYGRISHLTIPRHGDFLSKSFLEIEPEHWVPELVEDQSGNVIKLRELLDEPNVYIYEQSTRHAVGFVDAVGHYIIDHIDFWVDGTLVEKHTGEWLDINAELTTSEDKYNEYCRAVGKYGKNDPANVQKNMYPGLNGKLIVPLQFSWARSFESPLPIRWMYDTELRIDIVFNEFKNLYYSYYHYKESPVDVSGDDRTYCQYQDNFDPILVDPRDKTFEFRIYSKTEPRRIVSQGTFRTPRKLSIKHATIVGTYISIPNRQVSTYFRNEHHYLIEQVQNIEIGIRGDDYPAAAGGPFLFFIGEFMQPIKEIYMITRQKDICLINQPTNFYKHSWQEIAFQRFQYLNGQIDSLDLTPEFIEDLQIMIGDDKDIRIPRLPGSYFHTLIPYRYHARNTEFPIYCMNFSLMPDKMQPSGYVNFSLLTKAYISVTLNPYAPPSIQTFVTGRQWYRSGLLVDGVYQRTDLAITAHIYAKNYNFLTITKGKTILRFLN